MRMLNMINNQITSIQELPITTSAKTFFNKHRIITINDALTTPKAVYDSMPTLPSHRTFLDELFEAIEDLGYPFAFEQEYLANLRKIEDGFAITTDSLALNPSIRTYLKENNCNNIGELLNLFIINGNQNEIKRFLFTCIKPGHNYNWLLKLVASFGSKGAILFCILRNYIGSFSSFNLYTPLEAVFTNNKLIGALHKNNVYQLGELVKYDRNSLLSFAGLGPDAVNRICEILNYIGMPLGSDTTHFIPTVYGVEGINVDFLGFDADLNAKLYAHNITTLRQLLFLGREIDASFLTSEEIRTIRATIQTLNLGHPDALISANKDAAVELCRNYYDNYFAVYQHLQAIKAKIGYAMPIMSSFMEEETLDENAIKLYINLTDKDNRGY